MSRTHTWWRARSLVLLAFALPATFGELAAQLKEPAASKLAAVFRPYGKIARLDGSKATAQQAGGRSTLSFALPNGIRLDQVLPGQPVYAKVDLSVVRIAQFPISVPNTNTTVGRGAGQGKFIVRTKNVVMGANGLITGQAHINSEDFISGFTGVVWIRVFANDGTPLHVVRAGCWGVNLRSGRDEVWSKQIPLDAALQTRRVEILAGNMGCGRDRFEEAMEDLKKAGEAAAAWADAYASAQGGSGSTGTSTTTPTTPQNP